MRARLDARRAAGRPLLVPYLTAGFPDAVATPRLMAALAAAGADVIELGVPFSDPLADGPTIQGSSQASLDAGGSLDATLASLRAFRRGDADTPVVLFTYLNPVVRRGVERFLDDALEAGADGVLLTDLPLGEDPDLEAAFESSPLDLVRLIAPTTPPERALRIAARAQGFVYYISRTGVTGARSGLRQELAAEVSALRAVAGVPVVVGFGISTPAQAAEVAGLADGVVVGSALIDAIRDRGEAAAGAFIAELREALDRAPGAGRAG
ncbi:MAG: tryptophan synthase subunit alpha [Gemmatimonadetes bacterium]|nr:tryptophan synthase subunit alpha [Gemmatimonadota bacterium]